MSRSMMLRRASVLEHWARTSPEPLSRAYRRQAGALRLMASVQVDA